MDIKRIKLWDLPTRLFHWSLVILIAAAIISGKVGGAAIDWHGRIGLVILGLITFRLVWGIIGSSHARFVSFFPTPGTVTAYLRGEWRGVGHNPLGAFSVFGLLALIALQVGTGIFGNDDIAFNGPLFNLVSKELSDSLTGIHKLAINLLIALIALHLAAIAFYTHVKKEQLVKPMITGWKEVPPGHGESARGGGVIAIIIALVIALAAVYAASGNWLRTTPTPGRTATPSATW
jgi:cytochrome b